MTFLAPALLATLTFATACASAPSVPPPLDAAPPTAPDATLVWVGRGEAERKDGGRWVRAVSLASINVCAYVVNELTRLILNHRRSAQLD